MRVHFRVGQPAPGDPVDGDYVSSVGAPGQRRQEWHYGAYQPIQILNGPRLAIAQNNVPQPAIFNVLRALTPIYLVRFDHEDIIRSITDGGNGSRCIQFETVYGDRQETNQACVDAQNGWLVLLQVSGTITKNSTFFSFNGAFLPGHVESWHGENKVLEVEQTLVPRNDYPPDFFTVPEDSNAFVCQEFRRAFAVNTPQPEAQSGSMSVTDVKLQGMISMDGHVYNLKPIDQSHPDLNEEAVKIVSTWTFSPAYCSGKPASWEQVFVVHFKGR